MQSRLGCLLAIVLFQVGVGLAQLRRPRSQIVSIAGDEMYPILAQQFVRETLRGLAESPGQRARGDLDKAAVAHPLQPAVRVAA